MKYKRTLFFAILLVPLVFLLVVAGATIIDLIQINRVNPETVRKDFKAALPKRSPWSFPLPDIRNQNRQDKTVFVFGASSLILSDGGRFPDYLETNHKGLRVVNFGVNAIDSLSVRQRVSEALSIDRPDIIVLYYGHNDYNVAYHAYLLPKYFDRFGLLLRLAYVFHFDRNLEGVRFANYDYATFARLYRPKLIQLFQKIGIIAIKQKAYEPVNRLILDQYMRNNEAILEMAASMKIPVVSIIPIGNLHAEPYGDLNTASLYKKGVNSPDYDQSLALLRKARDAELMTYDLRAKSPLTSYIRNMRKPNVYVLDLEKVLESRQFGFGNLDFVDYFHFNDRSHRLLADIIYDFMARNKLVGRGARK